MKNFANLILTLCLLFPGLARSDALAPLHQAHAAAQSWLALTDATQYMRSWEHTAPMFQKSLTATQWQQQLAQARQPLGAVQMRAFKAAEATPSLPGMPDGQYLVIQYATQFQTQPAVIETVTLAQSGHAGPWQVLGYYLRPAP